MAATSVMGKSILSGATSLMGKSTLSDTEATTYDRKFDDSLDTQSVISYAFDVHRNSVDLPPAPVAASRGSEFVCPYCGIVCPSQDGKNPTWRYVSFVSQHLKGE